MGIRQKKDDKTIQQRIAEEDSIFERIDEQGNKWRKVYFGGGEHCRNWLEQFKELGEVHVEEVDPAGFTCFEESGEKLCRVWLKLDDSNLEEFF